MSLEELYTTFEEIMDSEWERKRFFASLKGIDIDAEQSKDKFDKVKIRAEARLRGEDPDKAVELAEQRAEQETGLIETKESDW